MLNHGVGSHPLRRAGFAWLRRLGLVPSGGWHQPSSRPGTGDDGPPVGCWPWGAATRPSACSPTTGSTTSSSASSKSVIRDLAPHASTIDLTHGIRPFDVRGGSLALARAIPYVAEGVVARRRRSRRRHEPQGRSPSRSATAPASSSGRTTDCSPPAVALAGGATRAVELDNPSYHFEAPGATFAGRDVFAPAAAHLCNGVDLAELGTVARQRPARPGMIALPRTETDGIHAEVLWVDRFGNCQLNVGPDELASLTAGQRRRAGDVVTVMCGEQRRGAGPCQNVRRLGDGSHRPRARQPGHVRPGARPAVRRRRAGARSRRRRRVERRRRRHEPLSRRRSISPAPVASVAVRPATTLTIALLLALILVAGVITLMRY